MITIIRLHYINYHICLATEAEQLDSLLEATRQHIPPRPLPSKLKFENVINTINT
jgi:hypothetical protein